MQVKGCCPLDCQDSCAWTAHVEDGRVIRVEGAKDHPVTRGTLCAKVRDYETRNTAPGRLLNPLRRSGAKGSGQFEPISWDKALGEIASRFKAIIAEHGAEALMPFHYLGSMGVVQRLSLMRIFNALGASRPTGGVCGVSAGSLLGEGHPVNVDPETAPDAKLIILWGQNVLSTCHHQWHFIDAARRNGARVIAIDPYQTRTAKQCDTHLAPIPGSDAVLAAAIGRHLLATGRADLDLADLWVGDLAEYRAAVEPWSLARAAEATGLAEVQIADLAEAFAAAKPALIRSGIAPQQTTGGEDFVRGLSAIAILGGHWRHRGGGLSIFAEPRFSSGPVARPDLRPGRPRGLNIAKLGEILNDRSLAPPVKGLMVWSANPAATQIDAPLVRQGLSRDDLFTVVAEHFMTDTARHADIVLPATTQFEHFDIQGAWGHHYMLANNVAVAPAGEARSSGAIMRGLAQHLGLDDPAFRESDEQIAAAVLPAGWTLDEIREAGWKKSPEPPPAIAKREKLLRLVGQPIVAPVKLAAGTLQLLTPKSHYFLNSTFANMPRHRGSQGAAAITMNSADAKDRSLTHGARVTVKRGAAQVEAALDISDAVRPGVVLLEGKWWDDGDGTTAPMNRLTQSRWSPAGQPAYNETYVTVEAAG